MTDIFAQEGINFMSASMASTSPSAKPSPIPAPDVSLPSNPTPQNDNALTIFGDNEGHDIPGHSQGNSDPSDSGTASPQADPQQISQSLAGAGNEGAGTAGVAPPQPSTTTGGDIFDKEGIKAPTPAEIAEHPYMAPTVDNINSKAIAAGIPLPPPTMAPGNQTTVSARFAKPGQNIDTEDAAIAKASADMSAMHSQSIDLSRKLYGDDVVNNWISTPQGPVDGMLEAVKENKTIPFLNLTNAAVINRLQKIAGQVSSQQPVSPEDQQFAADHLHDMLQQEVRGFTRGGKLAYNISGIPAWMFEFATADGAASFLSKGVGATAGAVGLSESGASLAASLSKLPMTTAFMPAQYIPAYAERQYNASTALTDKGVVVAKTANESPAKSALMAYGGVAADVASAYAMPLIGKGTSALASPMIVAGKALPVPMQEALFSAYKAVEPMATYSKMLTPMGWNNVLSAVGSFQLDKILRGSLDYAADKDMTFGDALNKMPIDVDDLLIAGGLTAIHGGVSSAHSMMASMLERRGMTPDAANEATSNMSATEKEHFVNNNIELPQSPYPSANDNTEIPDDTHKQYIDDYQRRVESLNNPESAPKKPLVSYIKSLGGIDPDSDIAGELRQLGITSKTAPGLYRKGGDAGELDNIPVTEFNGKFNVAAKSENGYVDRDWLIEQIQNEARGKSLVQPEQQDGEFARMLDEFGINPRKATGEDIYKVLGPYPEAKILAQKMGDDLTNQEALELKQQMEDHGGDLETVLDNFLEHKSRVMYGDNPNINAARDIIRGGTAEAQNTNPAFIHDKESGFNEAWKGAKLYAAWIDNTIHIEALGKLARERGAEINDSQLSPAQLSLAKSTPALAEEQWTTRTTSWDADGNKVTTGKGLKQIGDDFDNAILKYEPDRNTRAQDMRDFRKAMTFIEDKTKDYNPVSDKDYAESQATLSRLTDKYGDQMKWFETFAKEYRDWDNRILHNLVTSGLKTQAWYDDLTAKREWYSSTGRIIDTEYPTDVKEAIKAYTSGVKKAKGKGLGADINPRNIGALQDRKSSTLDVQDPIISSMRNSAIIIKRAMLNKLRLDTAKFADYFPEKVKVKNPRIIRDKVEHSYDPKLRTKLEQVAEFLGVKLNRVEQGDIIGDKKNNLGAYSPSENAIYIRQGSTEGTLTHEVGHALDERLGLEKKLLGEPVIKTELEKLAEDRLRSSIKLEQTPEGKTEFAEEFERNPKKYVDYVKSGPEAVANFFDAYVNSPAQAREKAPNATAAFEKLIAENPQLNMLKEMAPSTQRATEVIQRALLDFKGPQDSVPFYDKGRLKFLVMDKDTALSFNGLDQLQNAMTNNFFQKVGKAQAKLLQFGATNNPYFMARHFTRSVIVGAINNPGIGLMDYPKYFGSEIPKAIANIIGRTDAYRDWKASSGGLRTFMDTTDKNMEKLKSEMLDKADFTSFLNPANWAKIATYGLKRGYGTAKELADYTAREASYNILKDKGYSDLQAGFLSLEGTGNYTRHGWAGKIINDYVPFFNDSIQGADRFVRAIARDPVGTSVKAIALVTLPQIIISGYYLFGADDETRNEYLNLSDFRRNTAFNVKIAGQWIPIPRPFSPGFFFGAIPEHMMIHYSGIAHPELKNFWLHTIGDAIHSLSPAVDYTNTIPPVIKALLESQTNWSFYRHMALFHGDLNTTAPENQYNARTSESAKMLGKVFGISPVDIDNTVYDMSAHIGVYATQLSDYAINKTRAAMGQQVNEKPTRGSDNPIWGPLMQQAPVGTASGSYQEFNEHSQDLAQQQNRYNELKGQDQADFANNNNQDLALHPQINAAATEVRQQEHEIREITNNANLTGDEKAEQIKLRQQKIEIIVEGANQMYRDVKGQK